MFCSEVLRQSTDRAVPQGPVQFGKDLHGRAAWRTLLWMHGVKTGAARLFRRGAAESLAAWTVCVAFREKAKVKRVVLLPAIRAGMAENRGIGRMEIHSVGPGGVDLQASLTAESPPQVSLKDSKLVQCQNNLAEDGSEEDGSEVAVCRICWGHESRTLYYPCACRGSIKYVHEDCLLQWLKHTSGRRCQICNRDFALSLCYHENTPSILSFRKLLHGVVTRVSELVAEADRIKRLDILGFLLSSLVCLGLCWAFEMGFRPPGGPLTSPAPVELGFDLKTLLLILARLNVLKRITPHIHIVGLARPVAFVFAGWVFPRFGYSISINSAINRFSRLGCLGLEVGWCLVKGLFELHTAIKDDLYLVRTRVQNYRETEKAHVD